MAQTTETKTKDDQSPLYLYVLIAFIVIMFPLVYVVLNYTTLFEKPEPTADPTSISSDIPDLETPAALPEKGYVRIDVPYVIDEITTDTIIVRATGGTMVLANDPAITTVVDENGSPLSLSDVQVGQGAIVDVVPGESAVIHLFR